MNNRKIALAIIPAMIGLSVAATGTASAQGASGSAQLASNLTPEEIASRQSLMFNHQAAILGVSADVVKEAWAQGKTMKQIISENKLDLDAIRQNITNDRIGESKNYLQTLVGKNVITQAQADERLATVRQRMDSASAKWLNRNWQRGAWL